MDQAPPLLNVNQAAIEEHRIDAQMSENEELEADASIQQPDDQADTAEHGSDDQADTTEVSSDDQDTTESDEDELVRFHRPLYDAASSGNWENAERFLIENPTADITQAKQNGMTILHVAATMGHAEFIKKLFASGRDFPREAMIHLDDFAWSALHYAASYGILGVVKVLVKKDQSLTQVLDGDDNNTPLRQAANNGSNKRVLEYLVRNTPNDDPSFSGVKGAQLINALAIAGYYDICLYLLNQYPEVADYLLIKEVNLITTLVRSPDQFLSGSRLNFFGRCIYHCIPIGSDLRGIQQQQFFIRIPIFSRIRELKYQHGCIMELLNITCKTMSTWKTKDIETYLTTHSVKLGSILYESAENGVIEIIRAFIKHTPDFMDNYSPNVDIILWAIENRREHVFNFMMERDAFVKLLPEYAHDKDEETYLHAAAKLAPYTRLTSVSSPALQMQRELQWFRGVEKIVRPIMRTTKNAIGQTARDLLTIEHKDLAEKAEIWLKDTANSCLVVAALIITVVFAAAFTIPGGNIDDTGIPLFLNRSYFMVFIVSDAVGMFSAATSILMFLSILTARYAVDDFLSALPTRLILGLVSLLIALASMMVAFGAALYMIMKNAKVRWMVYPIIGIISVPVGLFIMLQLPLIVYMVRSTYGPSILKPMKTPW